MYGLKILIYLIASHQCTQVTSFQDDVAETEILRTSQRGSSYGHVGTVGYQTSVIHRDERDEEPSVSSISVQMSMRDSSPIAERMLEEYLAANEQREYEASHLRSNDNYRPQYSAQYRHSGPSRLPDPSAPADAEVGASNEFGSVHYSLPPDGFLEQFRSQNHQYVSTSSPLQYTATPAPMQYASGSSYQGNNNYDYNQPQHSYSSNQFNQPQLVSTAAPQVVQHASTAVSRAFTPSPQPIQYYSTPSHMGASSISPRHQFSQNNYISSPSPVLQYESTPQPNFATTIIPQFMSSPSPIDFGNRIKEAASPPTNHIGSDSNLNQMQIDHYNNAINGVRKPKEQYHLSIHVSSTPAPDVSSDTSDQAKNWRTDQAVETSALNNYGQDFSQGQYRGQNQYYLSQHDQHQQPIHINSVESANTIVPNVVNPTEYQSRSNNFRSHTRDLERETNQPIYSHGDYGWRLDMNRPAFRPNNIIDELQNTGSFSTPKAVFREPPPQTLALHSSQDQYNSLPTNKFVNQVSSTVGPINYNPRQPHAYHLDNSHQQNIDVGYSIGFSNNEQKNPPPSVISAINSQYRSDVIRGLQKAPGSLSDPPLFTPDSLQPQDYVTNALKTHQRFKQSNSEAYGNYPTYDGSLYSQQSGSPASIETISLGSSVNNNLIQQAFSTYAPNYPDQNSNNPTQLPSTVTSYFGNSERHDNRPKWQNLSPNVEFGSSNNSPKPEPITQNSYLYGGGGSDIVTSLPFYSNQIGDASILRSFDHANALKSIQPIDLTDVVPVATLSPQSQNYLQNNQFISPYHKDTFYKQNQIETVTAQPSLGKSYRNYYDGNNKPFNEQVNQYYKDKNVDYSVSFRPKTLENPSNVRPEYLKYANVKSNIPIESQLPNYSFNSNLQGQSSNVDSKRIQHMNYIPTENFRQAPTRLQHNNNYQSINQNQFQLQSPIPQTLQNNMAGVNHLSPTNGFNYQEMRNIQSIAETVRGLPSSGPMNNYEQSASNNQPVYEGRINQNLRSHNLDTLRSSHSNRFGIYNNKQAELDPHSRSVVSNINGIKVVNPFNVDLNIIADMLKGKPATDDTRMRSVRDDIMRTSINLDTPALQDVMARVEHLKLNDQINPDYPSHDYGSIDSVNSLRAQQIMNDLIAAGYVDIPTASPRPFYGFKYSRSHQEDALPSNEGIASDQIPDQSILNSQPIDAVMDQPQQQSAPVPSMIQPETEFSAFDIEDKPTPFKENNKVADNEAQRPNSLAIDETQTKVLKKVTAPYPLLKPPRLPIPARQHRKPDGRHKHIRAGWGGTRKIKAKHIQNNSENERPQEYQTKIRIQTKLRPPPRNKRSPLQEWNNVSRNNL